MREKRARPDYNFREILVDTVGITNPNRTNTSFFLFFRAFFKHMFRERSALTHAEGIPPLPTELPSAEVGEGARPDGGGGAVGSSVPIFLLKISNVLNIFLRAPSTATPCASSACVHQHHSFRDEPSKFGVYLCSLKEHSHAQHPSEPHSRNLLRLSSYHHCHCFLRIMICFTSALRPRHAWDLNGIAGQEFAG